jgi:hypothetical protein
MSRFRKFLGDLEIKVKSKDKEGKEMEERFIIKPTTEDRLDLMEKFQIKDAREKLKSSSNVLVNIFKNSKEGDETEEEIREFVDRYYLEIIKQITIAFGWTTEEQIQKQVDLELKKQVPEGSPI